MKFLSLNFFRKSVSVLLVFAFIFMSFSTFSVNAYAAEEASEEVLDVAATTSSRVILSSGSVVNKTGNYTSNSFTTPDAGSQKTINIGMSYYIACSSGSFNIYVYKKSTNGCVSIQDLTINDTSASAQFYLDGNTTYYFTVKPGNTNTSYDFAFNLYYYK